MITINNYLDKFTDVFIAEMGACQEYDIDELCKLVRPKYGIITKIGSDMGIKMETIKDNSDAAIASMLIEGFTMGVTEMKINTHP